jgi:hypothetical protein
MDLENTDRIKQNAFPMGLKQIDFVKVDIEDGEIKFRKNSAAFLRSVDAKLIVEPHHVYGKMSTEPCCRMLESAGFAVHVRGKAGESEPLIEALPASGG